MTMMGRNSITMAMALGLALGLAATPALARSSGMSAGYDARAEVPTGDIGGIGGISAHRAQALRQCNERSASKRDYTWGDTQSDEIRACMAQHGEGE
jgi:hypothetical protein